MTPFSIVVADPPWLFRDALPGRGRGARKHYRCMTVDDICAMKIPAIAEDALLFLWRVASMQEEALRVMRAWGFGAPKSEIAWVKLCADGDPSRPRMGMGHYTRNAHEVCLIGAKGRGASLVRDRGVPSVIQAPRGAHSEKPAAFYEAVDRLRGDAPAVELFARRQWPNWVCLGDEMPKGNAA